MADDRGSLLQRHLLLVQALCDCRPSKGDCQVLAVISGHVDAEGDAWPGVNRIAKKAGIHRTTVLRSVERLESWGYVEVTRERGKSNLYRIALTSSVHATSASSASATSGTGGLVAPTHTTSSASATTPVAPTLPDQSHPRYPNSALELDSPNSEKRTQLPAALSFDDWEQQEQNQKAKELEQKRLQKEEHEARTREGFRAEYLEACAARSTNHRWAERLEAMPEAQKYFADLIPSDGEFFENLAAPEPRPPGWMPELKP